MAATSGGALKQIIEGAGLGLMAYRRVAPANAVFPYVVVTDGIANDTVPMGDNGAEDVEIEECQVDLWEMYYDHDTEKVVESDELKRSLKRAMHGSHPDGPTHVWSVKVPFNTSSLDADDNTVRTRYSVKVHRDF